MPIKTTQTNTVSMASLPKNPNLVNSVEEVADILGGEIVE